MAAFQDYYAAPIALNPDTGDLQRDATFTVHLPDDLAFATSLAVFDPVSGAAINPLSSNQIGAMPDFRVAGDPWQIILKSGSFTTKLTSVFGAVIAAGLEPAKVTAAIAAAAAAESARTDAESAKTTAETARDAALAAKAAAEAVPTTTDGIVKALIASESSQTRTELISAYVRFVDQNGDQLPAGSVTTIHVNTTTGDIDDITFEEA